MIYNETPYNSHWETKKLDSLGEFARGKSKHRPRNDSRLFQGGGYPLVQTGEVKNANLYIRNHTVEYNDFGLAQSKLWDKGTLCITIAANIAETGILEYPMCFPDSIVGFNAYETETTEYFMHYIFTFIRQHIQKSVVGSIQDNINLEYLQNLDFKIPEKPYQDKIVRVLKTIDDRIELNYKIEEELDSLGRLLFNYWFVQYEFPNEQGKPYKSSKGKMKVDEKTKAEIPEHWELCKLSQIVKNDTSSVSPRNMQGKMMEHYSIPAYDENVYPAFEAGESIESNKYRVFSDAILVSKLNPQFKRVWDPYCLTDDAICSTEFLVCRPFEQSMRPFCLAVINSDLFSAYMASKATSSTGSRKRIQPEVCMEYTFPMPDTKVLKDFIKVYTPIMNRLKDAKKENYELVQLRDWLLPLLMNGQVVVE